MTAHMGKMTATNTSAPTILVDMDGVLFDWGTALNNKLLELDPDFPVVAEEDRHHFDYFFVDGASRETIFQAMNSEGLYLGLDPIPGGIDAVLTLEEAGFNVFLCSTPAAQNPTCASEKHASIDRHLGHRWIDRTILTNDKTLVRGDVLIDDKPKITGAMKPVWQHLLFTQSYNRYVTGIPRLDSWNDAQPAIEALLDNRKAA